MKISLRMLVSFVSIFTLIYGTAHVYVWWRVVHPLKLFGVSYRLALGAFLLLFLSFPVIHFGLRQENGPVVTAVNFVSAVWMGMIVYFVLVTLCAEFLRPFLFTANSGRVWSAIITGIVVAITGYGLIEAHAIGVTNLPVRIRNLPASLEGMRLVQISDVHMGLIVRGARLEKIVTMVNDLHPDVIVITGDLVDAEALHMEDMVQPLHRLKSRYGVFAVTGNHEFFAGIDQAQAFIEQAGVTMLRNRWITVNHDLQLVGLDDPIGARITGVRPPSLEQVMQGIDRSKPVILLYHTPVTTLDRLQALGVNLQLSGHTHRGQLWPFNFVVKKIFATPYGRFDAGDSTIYVSRGTGTWGPPLRVGAPPEITLVTLTAR